MFDGLIAPEHLSVIAIYVAILVIPFWRIWKKAGFSPWLSLYMLIPLLNILMLFILAFKKWRVVPAAQAPPPRS
jgi:hypothetical protein